LEPNPLRAEAIQKWKYESEDSSILYPPLKKYVVAPSAKFVPEWMSPNWITAIGFAFTLLAVLLCMVEEKLTVLDVHLICWFCALAFFFDALDGEQGRKWRKEKRDVYVLTQLFDHGFDSLTVILNTYIISRCLRLDPLSERLLFLTLTCPFLVSTFEYKVKRVLYFGFLNNPTEAVALDVVLLTFTSFFPLPDSLKPYIVGCFAVVSMLSNLYTLSGIWKVANRYERLELYCILFYFFTLLWNLNNHSFGLHRLEFGAMFHLLELRIVMCEIVKENCPLELLLFITPVFLLNLATQWGGFHLLITGILWAYCVWLWKRSCNLLCSALKMPNALSKPPVSNNPFQVG
jgi:phosphatidylglycerophosphate synthase